MTPRSGAARESLGHIRFQREGAHLTILQPRTIAEAVAARAAHPDAVAVAGGTGVLLELNRGVEPEGLLDLSRVAGWRAVRRDGDVLRLGAGVTYTQVLEELGEVLPGLAAAARTVASRQIRNRGTLVGALVLADPSGDALAALGAAGAQVELVGPEGVRRLPVEAFVTGPGTCALGPGELVAALHVPIDDGPFTYAKAGARNAMARAVCGVAVALHPARRAVTACAVGVAAVAVRPAAAEALASERWDAIDDAVCHRFGALVAEAADPEPDDRGSVAYRRRLAAVLGARALRRAFADLEAAACS